MSAQTVTFISGVVLLALFVVVGWYVRRRHRGGSNGSGIASDRNQS